jgi:ATP-binding cassette subfamily G (WHITE) protein 2 (PDR)
MFDPRTTREVAEQVISLPAWAATEEQQPGLEVDTPHGRVYPTASSDAEKPESYDNTPSASDSATPVAENGQFFMPITHEDRQTISRLARTMSRRQSSNYSRDASHDLNRVNTLQTIEEGSEEVDPTNKAFDLYKWLRLFMHNLDQEDFKRARAGIVFRNLGVSGSGSALQLQQTVAGLTLEPFRALSSLGGKGTHKQIIQNFNGFLKSGELLVVLGRPGSGCSTFLKTLCGETHGLSIDKGSTLHYNGEEIYNKICVSNTD